MKYTTKTLSNVLKKLTISQFFMLEIEVQKYNTRTIHVFTNHLVIVISDLLMHNIILVSNSSKEIKPSILFTINSTRKFYSHHLVVLESRVRATVCKLFSLSVGSVVTLQSSSSGNNFDQFSCDDGLSSSVVRQRQLVNHLA